MTEFSFVWEAQERGEDWYRIHDLLRRLDYEEDNETAREAHEVLEKYYREKGEIAEAIYHANRLDWERGVEEWVKEFDEKLKFSRYDECRSLTSCPYFRTFSYIHIFFPIYYCGENFTHCNP